MPKFKDITGQKFGKLTVVCFAGVLSEILGGNVPVSAGALQYLI